MLRKAFTLILLAAAATSLHAKDIKGSVRDTEGKGIAGVVVSDGLNTVVTDAKGRFKMDADADSRFVFVSTPSGYVSSTLDGETLFYKEIQDGIKRYDFTIAENAIFYNDMCVKAEDLQITLAISLIVSSSSNVSDK